jgi:hypothetical protein
MRKRTELTPGYALALKPVNGYFVATPLMRGQCRKITIKKDTHMALGEVHAETAIDTLICGDIVGNGWNHMPDVADYIKARPGADRLGHGSECHLRNVG